MSFTITYFLHITIIEIRFQKKTTTQLTIGPSAIQPIPESGGKGRKWCYSVQFFRKKVVWFSVNAYLCSRFKNAQ
jgi:hypothetical protein